MLCAYPIPRPSIHQFTYTSSPILYRYGGRIEKLGGLRDGVRPTSRQPPTLRGCDRDATPVVPKYPTGAVKLQPKHTNSSSSSIVLKLSGIGQRITESPSTSDMHLFANPRETTPIIWQ